MSHSGDPAVPNASMQWTALLRFDLLLAWQFRIPPDPADQPRPPRQEGADLLAAGMPDPTNPVTFDLQRQPGPGSLLDLPGALPSRIAELPVEHGNSSARLGQHAGVSRSAGGWSAGSAAYVRSSAQNGYPQRSAASAITPTQVFA
ncbi:hypothetical protein HDA40_002097 [Hamadaea flava]|nr:hypothetical protein [Hamadaea flava]